MLISRRQEATAVDKIRVIFFSSGGYVWREYRYGGGYQNARIVAWHLSSPFFIARMPEKSSGE